MISTLIWILVIACAFAGIGAWGDYLIRYGKKEGLIKGNYDESEEETEDDG